MSKRILIVEDDENLAAGLAYNLAREGYQVERAGDGAAALGLARRMPFDLVILDLMLPGRSGHEVLGDLRAARLEAPVMILSAIDDEAQKVRGFDLGAVDYVTKPFGLAELLARVRVRLAGAPGAAPPEQLALSDATVHFSKLTVERAGVSSPLTPTEAEILRALARRPDEIVTRDELVRDLWGVGSKETRTLDTHVARLRKKIETDPAHPQHILTVHGVGYRLAR